MFSGKETRVRYKDESESRNIETHCTKI